MSDRSERGPVWLPLLWLLVVAVLGWHQWQFWQAPRLDSDVFALLPQDEQQPAAQRAMKQLAEQGERRVVVMLGGADWERVRQAAQGATSRAPACAGRAAVRSDHVLLCPLA